MQQKHQKIFGDATRRPIATTQMRWESHSDMTREDVILEDLYLVVVPV